MRLFKLAVWVVLAGCALQVQAMSLQDVPKDIPKTDLDLYMAKHEIQIGPKVAVPPLALPDVPGFKPVTMADLPDFSADVERKTTKTGKVTSSGLLSTINYGEFPERKVEGDREVKLKLLPALTGFKEEMEVRTYWQPGKAPLAVTLLGFTQACNDHNARAYQADLFNAGNHVLSFDSMLRNNMNRATGHGAVGNIVLEGQMCAQIIDSVMRMKDPATGAPFRDRISSVRLVGFSYGGNLMLQAMRDPRVKDWPVDRALVVSTPVDFLRTSQLFDLYDLADGTHFSKMSLAKLLKGYTPKDDVISAREQSLMRAGLGYSFHGDISLIFEDNLKRYMPDLKDQLKAFSDQPEVFEHREQELTRIKERTTKLLADLEARKGGMDEKEYKELRRDLEEELTARRQFASTRLDDVARWTFKYGRFLLVRPYWDVKADHSDFGRLSELLNGAPNYVQVVIAEDDPLNVTEDLQAFKATMKAPQLLMIPYGGHLGMSGTKWFQAMMAKYFAAK
jgi:predicted alpha/beta-fold hydrolase